jgi:uncharacterized protein YegL
MKENFIHVCFVIDESGSMTGSETDIIGGFNKMVEEQKAIKDGKCAISFFSFANDVTERFVGKDVNEIKELTQGKYGFKYYSFSKSLSLTSTSINGVTDVDVNIDEKEIDPLYQYLPGGGTAMNDGIATAINKIGKWLSDMPEDERPSKNLIVIMTDGEENSSREFTLAKVQEMIKHQTEKYNWSFIYMGMDITNKKAADDLGIVSRSFMAKDSGSLYKNYSNISNSATCYRCSTADVATASATMDAYLSSELQADTTLYEKEKGIKIQ